MFHFLFDLLDTFFFFSLRIEGAKQAWVSKRFPLHTATLHPPKVTFWNKPTVRWSYLRKYKARKCCNFEADFPRSLTSLFHVKQLFWVLEIVSKTKAWSLGTRWNEGWGHWRWQWGSILSSVMNQSYDFRNGFPLKASCVLFLTLSLPLESFQRCHPDHSRLTLQVLHRGLGSMLALHFLMMKMVPAMMPTRATISSRAHTVILCSLWERGWSHTLWKISQST